MAKLNPYQRYLASQLVNVEVAPMIPTKAATAKRTVIVPEVEIQPEVPDVAVNEITETADDCTPEALPEPILKKKSR